jgi:hypothetical protein
MKRFTLFTFLYLALGVCLTAIALGYPNLPSGLLARDDDPLLSQTEFTGHSTLVGDWSEHCWDDLGGSESELDDGSHFRSVFAANRCLTVCGNHCDYMASEF